LMTMKAGLVIKSWAVVLHRKLTRVLH